MMKVNYKLLGLSLLLTLGVSSCKEDTVYNGNLVGMDKPTQPTETTNSSFLVLNEDWFGHSTGTINSFNADGTITYRAFRKANENAELGMTNQFAAIYGDNIYMLAKQGNRLVVADKNTFVQKAVLTDLEGDGRAFVGANAQKGYVSTSNGVSVLNLETLALGKKVEGTAGQFGNMLYYQGYVFAASQKNVVVIDTTSDEIVKTLAIKDASSIVLTKDGSLVVGTPESILKVSLPTFEYTELANLTSAPMNGAWSPWKSSSLCSSVQENAIYWTNNQGFKSGNTIRKYNLDTKELTEEFFKLGTDVDYKINTDFGNTEEKAVTLNFSGCGINVDPLTGDLVLLVKQDSFSHSEYNWVFIVDAKGKLKQIRTVKTDEPTAGIHEDAYYWFPAMPIFHDNYKPEILVSKLDLFTNNLVKIDLTKAVVDHDSMGAAIEVSVVLNEEDKWLDYRIEGNNLYILAGDETGNTTFKLVARSNGQVVEKVIQVTIRK